VCCLSVGRIDTLLGYLCNTQCVTSFQNAIKKQTKKDLLAKSAGVVILPLFPGSLTQRSSSSGRSTYLPHTGTSRTGPGIAGQSDLQPEPSLESFQYGGFAVLRGALRLFGGAWHYKINQNSTYSFSSFNLGGLGALFGGAKPTKAPRGDGTASNNEHASIQHRRWNP